MFYFTCNESRIYGSFTFWNKLQFKNELFHDILIVWDAPEHVNVHINQYFTIIFKVKIYLYITNYILQITWIIYS